MDKKTIGILIIIATTVLCCLPGIAGLCVGSLALIGNFLPGDGIPVEDSTLAVGISVMILGLSLVFIAIPIGAGFWFWRSQKLEAAQMERLLIPEDDF